MLTGLFKDRTRQRHVQRAADVLARLLHSNSLKPHRFQRDATIGPFVVQHVCRERSLVVELAEGSRHEASAEEKSREHSRRSLLREFGFSLLLVSRRELFNRPDQTLARLRALLR